MPNVDRSINGMDVTGLKCFITKKLPVCFPEPICRHAHSHLMTLWSPYRLEQKCFQMATKSVGPPQQSAAYSMLAVWVQWQKKSPVTILRHVCGMKHTVQMVHVRTSATNVSKSNMYEKKRLVDHQAQLIHWVLSATGNFNHCTSRSRSLGHTVVCLTVSVDVNIQWSLAAAVNTSMKPPKTGQWNKNNSPALVINHQLF